MKYPRPYRLPFSATTTEASEEWHKEQGSEPNEHTADKDTECRWADHRDEGFWNVALFEAKEKRINVACDDSNPGEEQDTSNDPSAGDCDVHDLP